jgi:hypothetical protein
VVLTTRWNAAGLGNHTNSTEVSLQEQEHGYSENNMQVIGSELFT